MNKPTATSTYTSSEVSMSRRFSATYKLAILAEIEAVSEKGQVGQILRREGLYSSLISEWRKQRDRGAFDALNAKQRGPQRNGLAEEVKRLREQNARLEQRLGTAEELIEAQGNAFALLQALSRKSDELK
jgi:transposase